jgi:hypothetical protein
MDPNGSWWILLDPDGSCWILTAPDGSCGILLDPVGSWWILGSAFSPLVHCTNCIFSQRVKQCVNSISLGYCTLCLHRYTLSLKTVSENIFFSYNQNNLIKFFVLFFDWKILHYFRINFSKFILFYWTDSVFSFSKKNFQRIDSEIVENIFLINLQNLSFWTNFCFWSMKMTF